jgi:hypothetical protein
MIDFKTILNMHSLSTKMSTKNLLLSLLKPFIANSFLRNFQLILIFLLNKTPTY